MRASHKVHYIMNTGYEQRQESIKNCETWQWKVADLIRHALMWAMTCLTSASSLFILHNLTNACPALSSRISQLPTLSCLGLSCAIEMSCTVLSSRVEPTLPLFPGLFLFKLCLELTPIFYFGDFLDHSCLERTRSIRKEMF